MLMHHDGLSGQRIAPACLIELEHAILQRDVIVHRPFVLHAEDPVQILALGTHKRTALLCSRYRELRCEEEVTGTVAVQRTEQTVTPLHTNKAIQLLSVLAKQHSSRQLRLLSLCDAPNSHPATKRA
jgi:hypothetical protein